MVTLRKPIYAKTVYLKQTLVSFDGPQLVLFQSDRGFPVLALAVEEPTDLSYPMFMAEISKEHLKRYLNQKVDLRWIYRHAAKRLYYANWAALNPQGWLSVTLAREAIPEEYFPDHGFWSRHHTIEYGASIYASDTLASFAIDGSWDAADFSKFYGKFADLYAFLTVGTRELVQKIPDRSLHGVKSAIRSLGWRGGGSYVGFYDSLFSKIDELSPLRVNRIQYASPGTIELKGDPDALAQVAHVVTAFASDNGEMKKAYLFVSNLLSKEGLKAAPAGSVFSSDEVAQIALDKCNLLNEGLGANAPDEILNLCDNDAVVYAKITLSFYRRAKELHGFHAEGRVKETKLDASTNI